MSGSSNLDSFLWWVIGALWGVASGTCSMLLAALNPITRGKVGSCLSLKYSSKSKQNSTTGVLNSLATMSQVQYWYLLPYWDSFSCSKWTRLGFYFSLSYNNRSIQRILYFYAANQNFVVVVVVYVFLKDFLLKYWPLRLFSANVNYQKKKKKHKERIGKKEKTSWLDS